MSKSAEVVCVFVLLIIPTLLYAIGPLYDPESYIQNNPIIIEGIFVSDSEVAPAEQLEGRPGWFCPTNIACVLVLKVAKQTEGPIISAGDTICFKYRTSSSSYNSEYPNLASIDEGGGGVFPVELGREGLYSFRVTQGLDFRKGSLFYLDEVQRKEVLAFLAKLETDFYDNDPADSRGN